MFATRLTWPLRPRANAVRRLARAPALLCVAALSFTALTALTALTGCNKGGSKLQGTGANAQQARAGSMTNVNGEQAARIIAGLDQSRNVVLGPFDVVTVRVYGEDKITGDYTINGDGTILLPLVGAIPVAGKSPPQIAEDIRTAFAGGLIKHPDVVVEVKNIQSQKVFVLGAVSKPGVYPYTPGMTIIEALAVAGGAPESADINETTVTRTVEGVQRRFRVYVDDIGRGRARNVEVNPGDIIYIPKSFF